MRRSTARLRASTARRAGPKPAAPRLFTSTKTSVAPSRQTKSISPPGSRTLRSSTRYPRARRSAAAASSPAPPFSLALCGVIEAKVQLREADGVESGAMVGAGAELGQGREMLRGRIAFVLAEPIARVLAIQLQQELVAVNLG